MHSLVGTIGIAAQLVSGVLKLPVAKVLDIWGRAEGYIFMLTLTVIGTLSRIVITAECDFSDFLILGLILMAACDGVKTYAGAQVFYWVGYSGMSYTLQVFMADTSSLKNRAYVFAFSTAPYIGTTFAGPAIAQAFYDHSNWRWGHGVWAILLPVVSLPYIYIIYKNQSEARKKGIIPARESSGRSLVENIKFYFWEFDGMYPQYWILEYIY